MKRALLFPSLVSLGLATIAFVACTSGGGGAIGGSGTDGGPDPDFDIDGGGGDAGEEAPQQAILRTNGGGTPECSGVPVIEIGEFGNPAAEPPIPSRPVPNGTKEDATVVQVFCKVVPKAGGFSVYATLGRSGTTFELEAEVDGTGATTAGGMVLIGPSTGTWTSETCTLSQTTAYMGVAAGRYWAAFSCPSSTSTANVTCDVTGEVRLENCTQSE